MFYWRRRMFTADELLGRTFQLVDGPRVIVVAWSPQYVTLWSQESGPQKIDLFTFARAILAGAAVLCP